VQHDALLPRPPAGLAPGAVLALLVHIGLIAALTLVVDWRMKTPEPVSAELWAAIPQLAAPEAAVAPTPTPAPAPVPVPPAPVPVPPAPAAPAVREAAPDEAQIAVERAERRKLEHEQQAAKAKAAAAAEAERKKREAEQAKAEENRLARLREDQLRRMLGSMSASSASTGSAARDAAPSQAYIGRLIARIKENVVFSDTSGSIIARRLLRSSGVKEWDDAVLRAIDRTGSLPRDTDGRVPPTIIVEFRPKE
jgi:colicin import membrane protein